MRRYKTTYSVADCWPRVWDVAEVLESASKWQQDCLSVLCTLSGVGVWEIADDGQMVYRASCEDDERNQRTETGVYPVEIYRPSGHIIPTRVAQCFGLGEMAVCGNAGDFLQGDQIWGRRIYQVKQGESSNPVILETTLPDILKEDGYEDVYWKTLEWRHIQVVVDSTGGQRERFLLLSEILRRIADAEMDAGTFIPYGDQFADSDFI